MIRTFLAKRPYSSSLTVKPFIPTALCSASPNRVLKVQVLAHFAGALLPYDLDR